MEARLKDIAANSGEATTSTDMEDLIEIHEDYIKKIMRMCFLESKYKTVHELIEKILQISLDFRGLQKKYLLPQKKNLDYDFDSDDSF